MWEGLFLMFAFVVTVSVTVVAVVVMDEATDLGDVMRHVVRGWTARRSIAARVAELESRLATAERKLARSAA